MAESRDVIRVPNQALRFTPTTPFGSNQPAIGSSVTPQVHVWLLRNGRPTSIAVTPGLEDDTFTEIVKGDIHVGDQVIVAEDHAEGNSTFSSPGL